MEKIIQRFAVVVTVVIVCAIMSLSLVFDRRVEKLENQINGIFFTMTRYSTAIDALYKKQLDTPTEYTINVGDTVKTTEHFNANYKPINGKVIHIDYFHGDTLPVATLDNDEVLSFYWLEKTTEGIIKEESTDVGTTTCEKMRR